MSQKTRGAHLNEIWGVRAAHALYIHDGQWYHRLQRFPGALFDQGGYIIFRTEEEYLASPHLIFGKRVHVRKPGISGIHGYVQIAIWAPLPEEVSGPFVEGSCSRISVNSYERDPRCRQACIEHYGCRCAVCEVLLSNVYGPIADGLIHVHHLKPIATIGSSYAVDPIRDVRPVCPNCHAVLHRRNPPFSIEELKAYLKTQSALKEIGASAQ